jgi:hypothetical protein
MAQVFYFKDHAREEHSLRVPVAGGEWQDLQVPLPALGPGYRLRFDPPADRGTVIIASLALAPRTPLRPPAAWPRPHRPELDRRALEVRAGAIRLAHAHDELGSFMITVAGRPLSAGFNRPLIGYLIDGRQKWIDVKARTTATAERGGLTVEARLRDEDGATWRLVHRFTPADFPDAIDVESRVAIDQPRDVVFLPLLVLTPWSGPQGTSKQQALLPGLEYLDKDEPSSSQADIIGPGSRRQVPDSLKITFPLMSIAADGRYVGLIWEPRQSLSALFDTPDRLFHSGGHVMGLLFPGSNGGDRDQGSLLPHGPQRIEPGKPLAARATIIGGLGESVVPAIRQYWAMRGGAATPDTLDLAGYVRLASAGWLDSKARVGSQFRHAWPGPFAAQPAADAALYMDWLAQRSDDPALRQRLTDASRSAIAEVRPEHLNVSGVGHVSNPVESLVYGHVFENARHAGQVARSVLGRFDPDGIVRYRPGDVDYARTHFATHANGLAAPLVVQALEAATVCGDVKLVEQGLRVLHALDRYAGTVPRGGQTWEIPLHTPDILAAAYLVRAYTLGYQLTGDQKLLQSAQYWAWTGLPFVYLVNPAGREVGPYATIAVYGATHWKAPNWMGLPVQWCGLVYSDALYRLAAHDAAGPWKQIADGITASGIQQTFPLDSHADRAGLLPDSFVLRHGIRQDASINPGTLQPSAAVFYAQGPIYSFHAFREGGVYLHAPGTITDPREQDGRLSFRITPALKRPVSVLLTNVRGPVRVRIDAADPPPRAVAHDRQGGWLTLTLQGRAAVEILPQR